ncbi:MAG: sigma-70 family RNA polymerase sigma factor [Prevotellaceae bacterium]|nr:sigma-70 family RNA polymerase sigma factor [Prevotellaceae bacterium]
MTASEFEHIAKELRPHLIRVGRSFFGDADRAEDVAQEVLMRLWVMRDRIAADAPPLPLATRMARNVCVSMWRHDRHTVRADGTECMGRMVMPPEDMEDKDNARMLQQAMDHLTAGERNLMRMRTEADMEVQQIAAAAGLTPRSVSVMLSRARHKLIELLKKGGSL